MASPTDNLDRALPPGERPRRFRGRPPKAPRDPDSLFEHRDDDAHVAQLQRPPR